MNVSLLLGVHHVVYEPEDVVYSLVLFLQQHKGVNIHLASTNTVCIIFAIHNTFPLLYVMFSQLWNSTVYVKALANITYIVHVCLLQRTHEQHV